MHKRLLLGTLAFASAALAAAFSPMAPHQGTTVRIAHFPNVTHAPALVAVSQGRFQKALGNRAQLDVKVVNAGPAAMEALLAGAIDMAYVGPSPALNTYIKSKGKALRVVSGVCSGGASLIATPQSGIKGIKDLDGKRVAVPQLGNTQDVSLRSFMTRYNLKPKERGGSVEIIPAANPDILTLFKQGQVDAAWIPEPWATRITKEAGAVRVLDERKLWPAGQFPTTVIVSRTDFLEQHPDLVQAIVNANAETIAWMKSKPAEAKKATNEQLKNLTGKPLADATMNENWTFIQFTTDPNVSAFNTFLKAATDASYIRNPPDNISSLFDLRFVRKGAKG